MAVIEPRALTLRDGAVLTLRCAEEGDAFASLRLRLETTRTCPYIASLPEDVNESPWQQAATLRGFRDDPRGLLLYAQAPGGALVGGLGLKSNARRKLQHWVDLGMAIVPAWQGRGLGRAMIEAALDFAAGNPLIEKVTLGVLPENARAHGLYVSMGFREEGRQYRHLRQPDGTYSDHVFMAVYVKPGAAPSGFETWRGR